MNKHNKRKKNRGYKNLFWLVKNTIIGSRELILYNRKPYKEKLPPDDKYAEHYHDKSRWYSLHDQSYPGKSTIERFSWIGPNDIIPVELVIDNDNPDMLIQRKKDNLFISSGTTKYIKMVSREEIIELRYPSRISPKLFPEVTEESGIVGVKIYEKKETKEV
jgi:hypothetical protein